MIIWIGSYPRSGNTLTRMLLRGLFGVGTWSLYGDAYDIGQNSELSGLVGHQSNEGLTEAEVEQFERSDRIYFVKTHENIPPWGKKIYIVRDARASIVSQKYYEESYLEHPMTLQELVMGYGFRGGWSDHVKSWTETTDANTLLLHYEEISDPMSLSTGLVERIEAFTGMKITGKPTLDFDTLKSVEPRFFRAGKNEPGIEEMKQSCPNLFWRYHGEMMLRLGYVDEIPHYDLGSALDEIVPALCTVRSWIRPTHKMPAESG